MRLQLVPSPVQSNRELHVLGKAHLKILEAVAGLSDLWALDQARKRQERLAGLDALKVNL